MADLDEQFTVQNCTTRGAFLLIVLVYIAVVSRGTANLSRPSRHCMIRLLSCAAVLASFEAQGSFRTPSNRPDISQCSQLRSWCIDRGCMGTSERERRRARGQDCSGRRLRAGAATGCDLAGARAHFSGSYRLMLRGGCNVEHSTSDSATRDSSSSSSAANLHEGACYERLSSAEEEWMVDLPQNVRRAQVTMRKNGLFAYRGEQDADAPEDRSTKTWPELDSDDSHEGLPNGCSSSFYPANLNAGAGGVSNKTPRHSVAQGCRAELDSSPPPGNAAAESCSDTLPSSTIRAKSEGREPVSSIGRQDEDSQHSVRALSSTRAETSSAKQPSVSQEDAATDQRRRKRSFAFHADPNEKLPEYRDTRPMICKEFAESGSCRYGLSCIFVHDRSAYYDRWREKVREQRKRAKLASALANRVPEHCPLCKDAYTEPVQTQCGHFFCSNCIISRYDDAQTAGDVGEDVARPNAEAGDRDGDGRNCPVCGAELDGIFNMAYDLQNTLNKQRFAAVSEEETGDETSEGRAHETTHEERREYETNLAHLGL